jgi:ketosteroid isomerase-like protein
MKMVTAGVLVLTLSATVASAQLLLGVTEPRSGIDPVLTKLADDFVEAFNDKDVARVVEFYDDNAVLMLPNAPLMRGKAAIAEYYKSQFAKGITGLRRTAMEAKTSGEYAFDAGTSSVQIHPGNLMTLGVGAPKREDSKYVLVYKRVTNEWKIAYEIFNASSATDK